MAVTTEFIATGLSQAEWTAAAATVLRPWDYYYLTDGADAGRGKQGNGIDDLATLPWSIVPMQPWAADMNSSPTNAGVPPPTTLPQANVTGLVADLAAKAPIASPTFTGTVNGVTKAMVGLGNADNTSDLAKPVSTATAAAIAAVPALTDGNKGGVTVSAAGLTWTVNTNANLTGPVTSSGNATAIADAALSIAKTSGLQAALDAKQATLVSATNIKTVNGSTLLGSGDLVVSAGAGGSTTQVQYNNAGALAGASRVEVNDNDLNLLASSAPSTPAVAEVKVIGNTIAGPAGSGLVVLATVNSFGQQRLLLPEGRNVARVTPIAATAAPSALGIAVSATGTQTAVSSANTNRYSRTAKTECLVTVAATTAVAGIRMATAAGGQTIFTGSGTTDGGYFVRIIAGPATGVATTTSRFFMGVGAATAAPTDVEPSSITNMLGVGYDAADANLQIMTRGAGAVVKTSTGIAVPTTDRTALYEICIYQPPGATQAAYITVTDLIGGTVFQHAETTAGNLPVANVAMGARAWSSVGGTSSVIGIALHDYYQTTDF